MNTNQAHKRRGGRGLAALAIALFAALAVPAAGWADSMTLTVPGTPVQEIGGQVSWSAYSEEPTLAVVAANNPGVPCASTPAADTGTTLTPGHIFEGGNTGDWTGATNFTPPTAGAYILCGWLEEPAGLIETDGGPITAATSLQVQVRAPAISLKLAVPRAPQPGRSFALNLTATSEVQRRVVVEGMSASRHGVPCQLRDRKRPAPDRQGRDRRAVAAGEQHRATPSGHLPLLRVGRPDRRRGLGTASRHVADRPRRHPAASAPPQATPPPSCVAA